MCSQISAASSAEACSNAFDQLNSVPQAVLVLSVMLLAKLHLAQNVTLATQIDPPPQPIKAQQTVGSSKWVDVWRPVQMDGQTDAGSADR
jgi:hypothetical protein